MGKSLQPHGDRIGRGLPSTPLFKNVTALTAAFLKAAVGQLYGKFDEQQIRKLLHVKEVEQSDLELLKRVVDSAKRFFKDPVQSEQVIREDLGDESDEI